MSEMENVDNEAVAQGGSYELIQRRLQGLGEDLTGQLKQLNDDRMSLFGSTDMNVEARVRVRTEHNCVARDIAAIGELLLFGYNVFLGLKRNITVADVFSLHKLVDNNGELEMVDVPFEPDDRNIGITVGYLNGYPGSGIGHESPKTRGVPDLR